MIQGRMGAMPVVVVQPVIEHSGAMIGMIIDEGPLADEAFGLAVEPWGVGSGADVPQAEPVQCAGEFARHERRAVVAS